MNAKHHEVSPFILAIKTAYTKLFTTLPKQKLTLAACLLLTGYLGGCAHPGDMRKERPISLALASGPSVKAEYRQVSNIGYSAALGFSPASAPNFSILSMFESGFRELKQDGFDVEFASSWYPYKSSSFHLGAAFKYEQSTVSFNADTVKLDTYGLPGSQSVAYDRQAIYLGLPIGWNWIFDNGITVTLDLGPRYRVYQQTKWTQSGESSVDMNDRNYYKNKTEDDRQFLMGRGLGIGYSF